MRTLVGAILFVAYFSMTVAPQTDSSSTVAPKKAATNTARSIPTIKCVDHDTVVACKSFKELVDARDEQLLREVLGEEGHSHRHISYVCFRPKFDVFSVITFDIPAPKEYQAPSNLDEDIAQHADDSVPTNREYREIQESAKKAIQMLEFEDFSDPPAVSQYTKDQWFKDHSKESVYSMGLVSDFRYENGLDKGPAWENGEWSMLAGNKSGIQHDPSTWFIGAYAWIERFNRQHDNLSARDDEPERAHITVDPTSIQIHDRYENPAGDIVDYKMQIHRLTGRFVEYFKFPGGSDETSGTCMIFK